MLGQVDLAHPAGAEPLPQVILARAAGPRPPRWRRGGRHLGLAGGTEGQDREESPVEAEQCEGCRPAQVSPPIAAGCTRLKTIRIENGRRASGPTINAARRRLFGVAASKVAYNPRLFNTSCTDVTSNRSGSPQHREAVNRRHAAEGISPAMPSSTALIRAVV